MYTYFRKPFPRNAHTEKLLVKIRAAAEEYLDQPIEALPYSKFKLFQETGSRVEFEADYIAHRRRMNVFAVMTLAEPENPRWLSELEDILWAICDEYAWALPAHIPADQPARDAVRNLDLFHNETAGALAEILELTRDRLHVEVRDRIEYEIRRRTILPFLAHAHKDYGKNNWAAVCACGSATVTMRLGSHEEAMAAIAHADELMGDFLDSYYDDGCCLEGPLYWNYGFGYFCFYADMVRDYTNGEHDWFKNPKIRTIAEFRNKFYLHDQFVLPFADASHELYMHAGLAHFLAKEYDTIALPDEHFELLFDDDPRQRTMELLRDLYWFDPELKPNKLPENVSWDLPDAQWCIRKEGALVFAAKGGHNDEPHNHNDVGSFLLFDNGRFILDDLGWPEYDKWYFTEKRREYLCSGSHGHNLPIIGGEAQKDGREATCSILEWTDTEFVLDLTAAYGIPGVTVQRACTFRDGKLQIKDTFTGCKDQVITERFVTRILPAQSDTHFIIAGWEVTADKPCTTALSTQDFTPRLSCCKQDNMNEVETAQLMDYLFTPDSDNWTVTFTAEKK